MPFAGRPVETDVSAGAWLAAALHDSLRDVGSLVPPTFAAFARVFHPAVRYGEEDDPPPGAIVAPLPPDEDVRWADVAAANGRIAHPAMAWVSITGSWAYQGHDDQPGLWNDAPAEGHLPVGVATALAAVLARHTTTPEDCWFGVWAGFGFVRADAPTLALPGREHWLVRGPIDLAAVNLADEPAEQSASLWWPADRAWCVATDVDLMSTYVGGSAACVAEVLAADGLEAAPVSAGARLAWDADTVNPPPTGAAG